MRSRANEHCLRILIVACRRLFVNARSALCRWLAVRQTMHSTSWKIIRVREHLKTLRRARSHRHSRRLCLNLEDDLQTTEKRSKADETTKNYDITVNIRNLTIQHQKWKEEHNDVASNRFTNKEIRVINNSRIVTQRLRFDVLWFVQHRFLFILWRYRKRENSFLRQHAYTCRFLICWLRLWWCMHHSNQSRKWEMNQRAQRLQRFVRLLYVTQFISYHWNRQKSFERRREAYSSERLQSASFAVKRRDKINSTRCSESAFECRSGNSISTRFIRRHYYLKNASFSEHDWFNIHDEEITAEIHSLHD